MHGSLHLEIRSQLMVWSGGELAELCMTGLRRRPENKQLQQLQQILKE
jgi:hypothetical protein